jgi:hypothetical protein
MGFPLFYHGDILVLEINLVIFTFEPSSCLHFYHIRIPLASKQASKQADKQHLKTSGTKLFFLYSLYVYLYNHLIDSSLPETVSFTWCQCSLSTNIGINAGIQQLLGEICE